MRAGSGLDALRHGFIMIRCGTCGLRTAEVWNLRPTGWRVFQDRSRFPGWCLRRALVGLVQGAPEYNWLPMRQRAGLLMLLRGVATLSHHSAGTDTVGNRALYYAEMGLKVLQGESGVPPPP